MITASTASSSSSQEESKTPKSSSEVSEEASILIKLKSPQLSIKESGLRALRQSTRESNELRVSLCTRKLLQTLVPMIASKNPSTQTNSTAIIVNLSIEPSNKVKIVRSGAVKSMMAMMKEGVSGKEEEYCLATMYEMSKGSLRFRAVAKSAGAERALMEMLEGEGGEIAKEMAKRTLKAVRGDEEKGFVLMLWRRARGGRPPCYFDVGCTCLNTQALTINDDLRFVMWDNHHQPLNLTSEHFHLMVDSGAPFGRGFASEDPILDRIDSQILRRLSGGFTPGGWCLGSSLLGKDPCGVYGKPSVLRPTLSSKRLEKLLVKLLEAENFRPKQCI